MCPLWPLHFILLYIILFCSSFYFVLGAVNNLKSNVYLSPDSIPKLLMTETKTINLTIFRLDLCTARQSKTVLKLRSAHPDIVTCYPSKFVADKSQEPYAVKFNVSGNFMGISEIFIEYDCDDTSDETKQLTSLPVTVLRKERLVDTLFVISVAVLIPTVFINFGCALNLTLVKESFRKPSGLIIGAICQFLFMPLISYGLARSIFPDSTLMQLGLFFTGISPSGGASNIWIYSLGGNLNLSIAITALSNIFAFFTMPLWTFTLGRTIFNKGKMVVPYMKVATFAFTLLPPVLLGLLLQKKLPKFSQLMVRILKPLSSCLILFIIVFATVTNWYLFKLFTAEILIAGFCLPFFGYVSAWIIAFYFRRSFEDCLAISIETGVQNTGIAIFMLRFSLLQPEADLTTVVPVAVALMTPVPLLAWYIISKCFLQRSTNDKKKSNPALKDSNSSDQSAAVALMDQNTTQTQLRV